MAARRGLHEYTGPGERALLRDLWAGLQEMLLNWGILEESLQE